MVLLVLIGLTGGVAAALWAGYTTLTRDLHDRAEALQAQVSALEQSLKQTERARGELAMALEETRARLKYAETRYDRDVPSGPAGRLHDLTERLLEDGVTADRLAFLLELAKRPLECLGPTTRRLRLGVEGGSVESDTVSLADGRLRVAGWGQAATDDAGRREAWFDPDVPVTLTLTPTEVAREPEVLEGVLPLSARIALGGAEYRLEVVAGPRGIVELTGLRCAYQ